MSNIFLQLTEFRFKREVLEDITGANANKNVAKAIEKFFSSQKSKKSQLIDYANLLIDLLSITTAKQGKQKLLIALVYFLTKVSQQQALVCLQKVSSQDLPVLTKIKFFSYIFKSTENKNIQKWLLKSTISLIQNQQKVSTYAGIIEHFDQVMDKIPFTQEQAFQIYYQLSTYLEKHLVYKKLFSVYMIRALQNVTEKTAQSKQAKDLIIKAIKTGVISDSALNLLNHSALKKNELYPILQILFTGDFEKPDFNKIKNLEAYGLAVEDIQRKMKIQAIPRLLSGVKVASYDQVAQRLNIKKSEVQSYIIDAIKQGILKAKLDEYQQTVIITRINLRTLRQEQRAKLQKDISQIIDQLSNNLENIA